MAWELLARSYGCNERLSDFVASRKQNYDRDREWNRHTYVLSPHKAREAYLNSGDRTPSQYEYWIGPS